MVFEMLVESISSYHRSIISYQVLMGCRMYNYFCPTSPSNPEGSDLKTKNVVPTTEELRKGRNEHSEMLATGKKVNKETEKLFQRGEDLNNQTRATAVNIQQLNNDLKSKIELTKENTRLIQETRDLKEKVCSLEGQIEQNAKEAKEKTQGIENAADKKIKNLNDQNSTLNLEKNALQEKIIRLERQLKTKVRIL